MDVVMDEPLAPPTPSITKEQAIEFLNSLGRLLRGAERKRINFRFYRKSAATRTYTCRVGKIDKWRICVGLSEKGEVKIVAEWNIGDVCNLTTFAPRKATKKEKSWRPTRKSHARV